MMMKPLSKRQPFFTLLPFAFAVLLAALSIAGQSQQPPPIKAAAPDIKLYAVEPAGFDDTTRSLTTGTRETVASDAASICDALLTPSPGELTFPINQRLLSGGLVVTDDQVRVAMRFAFSKMKLVIEPGGAVALAALLAGIAPPADQDGDTVVVISGSNVDPIFYAEIVAGR